MNALSFVALFLASLVVVSNAQSGQFITFQSQGRANMLFIPAQEAKGPVPLIVMLHGCTQNPQQIATATNFNALGAQQGFMVLYPMQPSSANIQECWNWFVPADQTRSGGEPQIIAQITQAVTQKYQVNSSMVYVAGFSAGAGMSVILGATYPDLFVAIGVASGLEFKAAVSDIGAYQAMAMGGPSPTTQGNLAFQAMGNHSRPVGVMVFHGTSDYTVNYINGQQVIQQYAVTLSNVLGSGRVSSTPSSTNTSTSSGGQSYTFSQYQDKQTGDVVMQFVSVKGMGHDWSGGSSSGTYTDPQGPNASAMLTQFFFNYTVSTSAYKQWVSTKKSVQSSLL